MSNLGRRMIVPSDHPQKMLTEKEAARMVNFSPTEIDKLGENLKDI